MSNHDEFDEQFKTLKSLNSELDNLDKTLNELVKTEKISEKIEKCNPKTKAELNWVCSYGIYTNYYLHLILNEINPKEHDLINEIKRLQGFKEKINKAVKGENGEEINVKQNKQINKKVFTKMIRNILNSKK